jgi:hypothetical protein
LGVACREPARLGPRGATAAPAGAAGAAGARAGRTEAPPGAPMEHRCRYSDSDVPSVSLVTRREECGPGRRLGPVGELGHMGYGCGCGFGEASEGWWALGLDYYGDDHGAAAVVVADPLADDAAG